MPTVKRPAQGDQTNSGPVGRISVAKPDNVSTTPIAPGQGTNNKPKKLY